MVVEWAAVAWAEAAAWDTRVEVIRAAEGIRAVVAATPEEAVATRTAAEAETVCR